MNLYDIEIRALNPDNALEIRQLVRLFRRVYGKTFPIRNVYDEAFWAGHAGSRFSSLVATYKGETIAHVALHPDKDAQGIVQLSFPLCDPDYRQHISYLSREAWSVIERQCNRQSWKLIYNFVFGNFPLTQMLHEKILGASEVAICPGYLPSSNLRPRGIKLNKADRARAEKFRTNVLVNQKTFFTRNIRSSTVYVPEHHLDIAKYLYKPLNLDRKFETKEGKPKALPADLPGMGTKCYSNTGVCHAFIEPSLLSNFSSTVRELNTQYANKFPSLYVFVNIEDPKAIQFCTSLEKWGYKFCGVLPLLRGRDSIVYWRESEAYLDNSQFYSDRAKVLANYITTNTIVDADELAKDKINGQVLSAQHR